MHITYIEGGFVEIINNGIVEKIVNMVMAKMDHVQFSFVTSHQKL